MFLALFHKGIKSSTVSDQSSDEWQSIADTLPISAVPAPLHLTLSHKGRNNLSIGPVRHTPVFYQLFSLCARNGAPFWTQKHAFGIWHRCGGTMTGHAHATLSPSPEVEDRAAPGISFMNGYFASCLNLSTMVGPASPDLLSLRSRDTADSNDNSPRLDEPRISLGRSNYRLLRALFWSSG
ncbi:hypothetical protein K503DRAFT_263664 [Rhizopogon vinicolor AM-OR11-026]|uniref:Uncharacterized protein n=1 Tax=Rhizopogon vinicolor AM-OR11-026 TaxID=1314800 RepID=A0A1B7NDG1_9AGAM|nr:hypothetical protein K503DRAFT_263664 [Rhizopogon vinicolor AM-OR11-026]